MRNDPDGHPDDPNNWDDVSPCCEAYEACKEELEELKGFLADCDQAEYALQQGLYDYHRKVEALGLLVELTDILLPDTAAVWADADEDLRANYRMARAALVGRGFPYRKWEGGEE
jgi:hypothetical protein